MITTAEWWFQVTKDAPALVFSGVYKGHSMDI